jgi:glutamate formiminotransferase
MPGGGPLVECVPNVSEGRDAAVLARLRAAASSVPGARLANVHADPDHHRSVFSLLGRPDAVRAAVLALADAVFATIDMRAHHGVHPRLGALDVVPFVPLVDATLEDAVALAHDTGAALAARHALPVYYYADAARRPDRRRLPDARRGGYEALPARLATAEGAPDAGPARLDPRRGATLVGARRPLVAFNVWLDTDDLGAARAIAAAVRESSGGLPALQALGLPLPSRRLVQVSMNLLDVARTPLPTAFDAVAAEATRRKLAIHHAELVGLAPRPAFAGRSPQSVGLTDFTSDLDLDHHVEQLLRDPT